MEQFREMPLEHYLEVLRRSKLFTRGEVDSLVADFTREVGRAPESVSQFSQWLLDTQKITSWQQQHLIAGRHKGFFLGKYQLLSYLGAGGMSRVYLARHVALKRTVAIKLLVPKQSQDPFQSRRFQLECEAIAALDHPNIVRAHDFDRDGDYSFLVMEYVEGPDLQKIVEKQGPLRVTHAAEFVRQAALGLDHAHSRGMVHRDIKPANLLLTPERTIKILDMGVVRLVGRGEVSLTLEQGIQVLGTVDYLPPEQFIDSHNVDRRADLYSLGCTLFYLLTGHPPFNAGGQSQRIIMHQTQPPPDPRTERPDVPRGLVQICFRMMAKRPEDRFNSAGEVAERLRDWMLAHRENREWNLPPPVSFRISGTDDGLGANGNSGQSAATLRGPHWPRGSSAEAETPRERLEALFQELLTAARVSQLQLLNALLNSLALPRPAEWFRKVFGSALGLEMAREYLEQLPHFKNSLRRFIEKLASQGEWRVSGARLLPGEHPELRMEALWDAMRKPVPLFAVRLECIDAERGAIGFGAFVLVQSQFRFLGPLRALTNSGSGTNSSASARENLSSEKAA